MQLEVPKQLRLGQSCLLAATPPPAPPPNRTAVMWASASAPERSQDGLSTSGSEKEVSDRMVVPLGRVASPPVAREAVRGEGDARLGRDPALEDVRKDGTSSVWGRDRRVRALKYDTGPSCDGGACGCRVHSALVRSREAHKCVKQDK